MQCSHIVMYYNNIYYYYRRETLKIHDRDQPTFTSSYACMSAYSAQFVEKNSKSSYDSDGVDLMVYSLTISNDTHVW